MIFCHQIRPRLRFFTTLIKSSTKPMSMLRSDTSTSASAKSHPPYQVSKDTIKRVTTHETAANISPPMVGVPCLVRWLLGPSS